MKNDPLTSVGKIDIIILPYVHALVNTKTEHGDLKAVVRNKDLNLTAQNPHTSPPQKKKKEKKDMKIFTISHLLEKSRLFDVKHAESRPIKIHIEQWQDVHCGCMVGVLSSGWSSLAFKP